MPLDHVVFGRSERRRLAQNVIGDADLANVVYQRRVREFGYPGLVSTRRLRPVAGQSAATRSEWSSASGSLASIKRARARIAVKACMRATRSARCVIGNLAHSVRRVEHDCVAALALRPVERVVREPKQLSAAVGVSQVTHPDRHRQVSRLADWGGAKCLCPTFRDRQRLLCARLGKEQRELIATDASNDIAGPRAPFKKARGLHQRGISRLVAVCVVDALEVIEIEISAGKAAAYNAALDPPHPRPAPGTHDDSGGRSADRWLPATQAVSSHQCS